MGRAAFAHLQKRKSIAIGSISVKWICRSAMRTNVTGCPVQKKLSAAIEGADGILIAAPVYNYDVAAATKNMIELTGSAWEDKIVGFLCAAGGHASYMSVMAYANSLMLDFRCVIIPRFAFATSDAFDGERINDKKVAERIETGRRRTGSLHQSAPELDFGSASIDRKNLMRSSSASSSRLNERSCGARDST